MLLTLGFSTTVGVLLALVAAYWLEPQTSAGTVVLVILFVGLANGIGALIWGVSRTGRSEV